MFKLPCETLDAEVKARVTPAEYDRLRLEAANARQVSGAPVTRADVIRLALAEYFESRRS